MTSPLYNITKPEFLVLLASPVYNLLSCLLVIHEFNFDGISHVKIEFIPLQKTENIGQRPLIQAEFEIFTRVNGLAET